MHICYIASVRIPNEKASGLAIMRQCEAFADIGHRVTLLRIFRSNHITTEPFAYYGIPPKFHIDTMCSIDYHMSLGLFGFYISRFSQMIVGFMYLVRHHKHIDVVYARDPWMLVLPVLFLSSKKIIWEAHQAQQGFWIGCVARRVYSMVCISEGLRRYYEKFKIARVLYEPSGVNLAQFVHVPSTSFLRERFNIPQHAKVIGYIGKYTTMGEEKGVDELVEACARVYEKHPALHLLLVGLEMSEIDSVRRLCTEKGLPVTASTLLPLIQKDFAHYVQCADILVMNYPNTEHYRQYMSPTKLFAYMGSKKLVVASDLPTVREIVDESMVLFIRPSDVGSLVNQIMYAIHNDLDSLKDNAYKRVTTFSWLNRADRICASMR